MSKCRCKNIFNNRKSNMAQPEPSDPTTARPDHTNEAETQESKLKNNFMKMIESHKEEMKNSLKEIGERQAKNRKKSINPLKKAKKKKQTGEGNGSRLEN